MNQRDIVIINRPRRDQAIEFLRVIAALGIVFFHAKTGFSEIGYAGLVAFLVLSLSLEVGINYERKRSIKNLALTFIIPFLIWSVIYALLNLARGRSCGFR
jgi:peptidoglycan/LPS O-acetylase OafA/YrhL